MKTTESRERTGSPDTFWQMRTLEAGTTCRVSLGCLRIWLRREDREWYVAHTCDPEQGPGALLEILSSVSEQADLSWQRWVTERAETPVRLQPQMPSRPVVVRPEQPLRLSAGSRLLVFVAIPVWVSIQVGGAEPVTLDSLPTRILSNTWFGEPAAGELCYALTSPVESKIDGLASGPHEAVCPVTILNHSSGELDFQRFCMRVEHLGIYRGINRLWTNGMRVEYRGEPGVEQVTISDKVPGFEKVEEKLCDARRPAKKTLVTKSFHLIKSLTGF